METKFKYLILFLLLAACSENEESFDSNPPPLFQETQQHKINLVEGYSTNCLTKENIKVLVNSTGDTIISGRSIQIEPFDWSTATTSAPEKISFKTTNFQNENEFRIAPDYPKSYALTITSSNASQSGTAAKEVFLNSKGDTIITGVEIHFDEELHEQTKVSWSKTLPLSRMDESDLDIEYLGIKEGLGLSELLSFDLDSSGTFWIGTDGFGLFEYDGVEIRNYTESETGLSNDYIWDVLVDSKDQVWLATWGGGVSKFDGSNFIQIKEESGSSSNVTTSLFEDALGNIWCNSEIGVFKINENKLTNYTTNEGMSSNSVSAFALDKDDNLLIGVNGGIDIFNGEDFQTIDLDGVTNSYISSIILSKDRSNWLVTANEIIHLTDSNLTVYQFQLEATHFDLLHSIEEDSDGNIWIGTLGGGIFSFNNGSIIHPLSAKGLVGNSVLCIKKINENLLYVGTWNGGVNILNTKGFSLQDHNLGDMNQNLVMLFDSKGRNFFGAASSKAFLSFNEGQTTLYELDDPGQLSITCKYRDSQGNLWFGTWGSGVIMYNNSEFLKYTIGSGLSSHAIKSICEDSDGNIWIGHYNSGIDIIDENKIFHFNEENGLPTNKINFVFKDSADIMWVGTAGFGVIKIDHEQLILYTDKEGLPSNWISTITEKDGLWLGTSGGGLCNIADDSLKLFNSDNGLAGSTIKQIIFDKRGDMWLNTDKGISLKNQENVINFNWKDGIKGSIVTDILYDSQSDSMIFVSNMGLNYLDCKNLYISDAPPALKFNEIELNTNINILKSDPERYRGTYDENHFTFNFAAIDWAAPHKIKYSYRMKGLNETWSEISTDTKADYRNIPYGSYTFEVKAIGESGEWSDSLEYHVNIAPPWWHTWWARTMFLMIGLICIWLVIKWRTAKLKIRQQELEYEVETATKEIRVQKEEIEEQHQEIKDSMEYAKRIQSAILPPLKLVKEYLEESFILYKPKDIVAGDFYWIEYKDGKVLFAAADCTGHGVPGAMVSVVCNGALNRSVREFGLTDPGLILGKARDIVIEEFEKSEEEVKDGMDIALCSLEGNKLQFAGAHNPLWIVRNNEIIETKANKQPIGKFDNPLPYDTHTIDLKNGDAIYIFSDGFVDQFGGEKGKKFKAKAFRDLLLSVQEHPMETQKDLINEAFETWRGNLEQIDDVCVIGVRV